MSTAYGPSFLARGASETFAHCAVNCWSCSATIWLPVVVASKKYVDGKRKPSIECRVAAAANSAGGCAAAAAYA